MHKLYDLKEMLCEELEEYADKSKLDMGGLEIVDKLAHAIKNIDKIIAMDEESYSNEYRRKDMGTSYRDRRGYRGGTSYRRMSRAGDMMAELHEMREDAPNETIRKEIDNLIHKMEQM